MAELNLKQIVDKLNAEFTGDVRKLVFWYDDNAEFAEDIDTLELENAKVLHLAPDNQFYTKSFLECVDRTTNYLVYAPFAKPAIRDNHLADTIRYSKEFFADRASLLALDLGIDERYKPVIQHYIKFFANKDRTQKFYDLELETFNRSTIEVALMSVLCKSKTASFEEVVRCILTDDGMEDNKYLAEFEKYDLLTAFWQQVEVVFGYTDPKPTLQKFVMACFATYASRIITAEVPQAWKPFISYKSGNIIAFLDNLMNSYLYDTAFLDRIHCYLPGWEIPKFRPNSFTNDYGFITDYLSEFLRELRKESFGDALDKYFKLGSNLNQRDTIAVRKMVSGMLKLLYPDGDFGKEEVREVLTFALEMRRRVKEQLKKIGGMEFYDVNFSFVDNDSFEETFVSVPEQGGGKLIPDGMCNPGHIYTVSRGKSGMIGVYRLETQMLPGNGKLERTGLGTDREAKESTNTAFNYLKANANAISGNISTTSKDYIINYQDLNGIGITKHLALPTVIAICSVALSRPTVTGLAVLGDISISGTIMKVEDLANVLQVCLDSGAKKVLLPITSAADIGSVPSELVGAFSLIFYSTPQEAVFKALGVD